ncbi:hypothetical protein VNO77_17168 [Canavalia gladiata]|uniref:Uncharacterized protein n=1 Tax=Canavalia gladiata TaxID=3824 RepID=A0AAN9LM93_CANGL
MQSYEVCESSQSGTILLCIYRPHTKNKENKRKKEGKKNKADTRTLPSLPSSLFFSQSPLTLISSISNSFIIPISIASIKENPLFPRLLGTVVFYSFKAQLFLLLDH